MDDKLKRRMTSGCPMLRDMVPFLEAMETNSVLIDADTEAVIVHNLDRVVNTWFINNSGQVAEIDVYDVTENEFKCRSLEAGRVYYR